MGGISFIHAGFLAGALAVAIPIAVHLLFRQKPRTVAIGSIQFLKIALQHQVRRRKLRRWLLLALRVAGVLLLTLLFARPYRPAAGEAERDQEVAIVIDQSASMAAESGGRSAFQRAQAEAEAYLRRLPERTVAHLAYADAAAVEPAPELRIDGRRGPGFGATDFAKALAWARDVLIASKRAERRVVLISDLQRSGLGQTPLEGWPPGLPVEIIDVGKTVSRNLAVTDAALSHTEIRQGEPLIVSAVIANTGVFSSQEGVMRLRVTGPTGQTLERTAKTAVDAGGSQVVRFALGGLAPGLYQGEITAPAGDGFPLDDRRWLAFEARMTDKVLLVDGAPGDSPFASQTYYLETALRLRAPDGKSTATPYEPVRIPWNRDSRLPELSTFPVVMLCNVGTLPDADLSALREFVASGGKLVIFAGDLVNRPVGERLRNARLLPAELVEHVAPGAYRLTSWDKTHPLLAPFSDPQHGDLRRLEFRRLARLKPESGTQVLARDQEGNPLLVEGSVGTGTILVFAVPAGRDWGDWPVSRLYLPLVHQVLGYLTHRLAGSERTQALASGPGREHPPGLEIQGNLVVSRNLDPRESDWERISPRELRLTYYLPEDISKPRTQLVPPAPDAQRPNELWRALVWGLFGVLLLETFIANRTHS